MMTKRWVFALAFLICAAPAWAAGSIIAATVFNLAVGSFAFAATAFAINMVISAIITKAFFSPSQPGGLSGDSPNPGNRQQIPPSTDNKLPVVYGTAYVGGTVVDLTITNNEQTIYYVFALCEVTNGGNDTVSFGNIYWGGKLCSFDSTDPTKVNYLFDESTGLTDDNVNGKLFIYLYRNGSYNPVNTTQNAIQVLSASNLQYKWDSTKLMTNTAFAIVKLIYNPDAGTTGLVQTKFQVTNSRTKPGDCIYDYLTSSTYGAGITPAQIDTASLAALNVYSDEVVAYTNTSGVTDQINRFRFDGVVDTSRTIMSNLQEMSTCCDCLVKFNEITAQWGVIVQKPTYTVAMALNDSNIVSGLSISPFDIASTYNIIECKFPDRANQDAFNTATFDLAQIAPELLFPNEPVNKQSLALPYVNNDIRAQYLATRLLKASREDLQVNLEINFQGLQLEAGDIVTVTNSNYGWVNKLFRINKIVEKFADNGAVTANLQLTEFNPSVYDDTLVTQFQPLPNTGLYDPLTFGTVPGPQVVAEYPAELNPYFVVQISSSTSGIIQYAEVYYSAFSNPTASQRIFAGTTAIQSDGTPYNPNTVLPLVTLADVPQGNWYFFSRMVNSLGTSQFSGASALLRWRPTTYQYTERYLAVAYADTITGTGFSFNPRNKEYYGLRNQADQTLNSTPSNYTWFLADPNFGTEFYLCYANRSSRRFSFDTGVADYAAGSGAFVPTLATQFDIRVWSALPDGINTIDLDKATGQALVTGTTTVGDSSGEILVTNNPDGKVVASLKQFLDFGPGVYTYNATPATLTIDIYGRVVGFSPPDEFYYTAQTFTATSGQTVFTVTRGAGYISGQCLVFQNGVLLMTSEFTDTGGSTGTVTLAVGATLNDVITIISFKSTNSTSGVYASFTRNDVSLTNVNSYTLAGLVSGYEFLYINGVNLTELDYNVVSTTITDFPSLMTGVLTIIRWSPNNLGVPNGSPVVIPTNTNIGQVIYPFNLNQNAFCLYSNGALQREAVDYTLGSTTYTLTETPTTIQTIMNQQTFARTGAV